MQCLTYAVFINLAYYYGEETVPAMHMVTHLLYSWKYWRSSNLVVWPQTKGKKILVEFKFGGGASQCITSSLNVACMRVYQGALV